MRIDFAWHDPAEIAPPMAPLFMEEGPGYQANQWPHSEEPMSLRISDADAGILKTLTDLQVATLGQLAVALGRNVHALRRRLSDLAEQGLIRVSPRNPRALRGRPQHMVTLREPGFDLLRVCGGISRSALWDRKADRRGGFSEHQLLVNDLRVHLIQLERFLPCIRVRYFGRRHSCMCDDQASDVSIQESVSFNGETIEFIPDGVFCLAHQELGKTLLFFLEADRATEPLTSARGGRGLAAKISAYQEYLRAGQYARYEEIVGAELRGFRLLLLIEGSARWTAACRLVRTMPPSEFIWVTRRELLSSAGCWGLIWAVGGQITQPLQSILGTKMPDPCPAPSDVGLTM